MPIFSRFGADFFTVSADFSRLIRDINGEKKHLLIDDLFHGYFFTVCPLSKGYGSGNDKRPESRGFKKSAEISQGSSAPL